jgi:chromate reductase
MRVLGISGSLRRDSYNTKLLLEAGRMFEDAGVEFVVYEGLKEIPPYDEDDDADDAPAAVADFRDAIAGADGLFFATPEYNSSVPGQLKNAIDWASRPKASAVLTGKRAAVVGSSTGMFGAVWAQAELRKVLGASGARVVEGEVAVGHAHTRFDEDGRLNDANLLEELRAVVDNLIVELAEVEEPLAA